MEETKFKVWDKKHKKFVNLSIENIYYNLEYGYFYEMAGPQGSEYERLLEDYILIQYIGLHDKNRKEIYTGDIVKTDLDSVYEIVWSNKINYDSGGALHSGFYIKTINDELDYYIGLDECEVIGNIYENPELLDKELS